MQLPTPINHFSHPRLDSGHARVIAMLKQKGAEKKQRHGEKTGGCLGAEHVGIILYIGKYHMYISIEILHAIFDMYIIYIMDLTCNLHSFDFVSVHLVHIKNQGANENQTDNIYG